MPLDYIYNIHTADDVYIGGYTLALDAKYTLARDAKYTYTLAHHK